MYVINKEICVRTVCAHEELLRGRKPAPPGLSLPLLLIIHPPEPSKHVLCGDYFQGTLESEWGVVPIARPHPDPTSFPPPHS